VNTAAPSTDVDVVGLADTAAVVDVCVRNARALDGRDWELLATCFADDVVVEFEGVEPLHGPAAVVDVCRAALGPLDASQHLLGNHHVTIDGDSARSECYVQAQHVRGALAPADKFVVAGTYRDTLARRDGAWKITSRRLHISWTDGNPDVLVMP